MEVGSSYECSMHTSKLYLCNTAMQFTLGVGHVLVAHHAFTVFFCVPNEVYWDFAKPSYTPGEA